MATEPLPLVFLDVDGTILPLGGGRYPYSQIAMLNHERGARLLRLRCELVWATAWRDEANEVIGPPLGLPQLSVAELPEVAETDPLDWNALHWKTRALVALAAGRTFVWIDDEIMRPDREWVAAHHPGQALLHRVDSIIGLTEADLDIVERWLEDLSP